MKINKDKNIGRVLFIVEGNNTEFTLLRKIFCDILHYDYIAKPRNKETWFVHHNNSASQVAIINTSDSNIATISDHDYLDSIFHVLINEHHFPVNKSAIYYLFDRDPLSNTDPDLFLQYIDELKNPYENDSFKTGQLLISYPSIESHTVSHFISDSHTLQFALGQEVKTFIGAHREIQFNKLSECTLLHATKEFITFISHQCSEWDIDEFHCASAEIFSQQENLYHNNKTYALFSMLTLAFLQLGIIELDEAT